jgi:hypothetical protein
MMDVLYNTKADSGPLVGFLGIGNLGQKVDTALLEAAKTDYLAKEFLCAVFFYDYQIDFQLKTIDQMMKMTKSIMKPDAEILWTTVDINICHEFRTVMLLTD